MSIRKRYLIAGIVTGLTSALLVYLFLNIDMPGIAFLATFIGSFVLGLASLIALFAAATKDPSKTLKTIGDLFLTMFYFVP